MKKYNYVYIVTNQQNNKKYIGKHSTDDLNDNYLGSGIIIQKIIKNNPNVLSKEIIEMCKNEEECYQREKYWINYYNAYEDSNFYNLAEGGHGNSSKVMKDRWEKGVYDTTSYRQKQSENMKNRMKYDKNLLQKREQGWNNWWNNLSPEEKEQWNKKENNGMYNKHHTKESIQKNKNNQPNLKRIYCDEQPNHIFLGLKQAAIWCGLKPESYSTISRCLSGKQKTAGKHPVTKKRCHWHEYKEKG